MVKDIFDTILDKEFHQLTSSELAEMGDFCKTEEEFMAMKQVLIHSKSIAGGPKLSPKDTTKEKLDHLFNETHGNTQRFIPLYLTPIIQIAAVVAIGFAVWLFFFNNRDVVPATQQLAENTTTASDTISAEKSSADRQIQQPQVAKETVTTPESVNQQRITSNTEKPQPERLAPPVVAEPGTPMVTTFSMKAKATADQEAVAETIKEETTYADQFVSATGSKYKKVSAPASSAKDISVDASKSPFKNQAATSVNVAAQGNVLHYLTARY